MPLRVWREMAFLALWFLNTGLRRLPSSPWLEAEAPSNIRSIMDMRPSPVASGELGDGTRPPGLYASLQSTSGSVHVKRILSLGW
ncbi:unnamed protein product [Gadus morhua 'NCC']